MIIKNHYSYIIICIYCFVQIQKMKGHNGYFGCLYCEIKGHFCNRKNHVYYPDPRGRQKKRKQLVLRDPEDVPYLSVQVYACILLLYTCKVILHTFVLQVSISICKLFYIHFVLQVSISICKFPIY